MTATDILSELARNNVHIEVRHGALHVRAPRGVVSPELRARLLAEKPALLAALSPPRPDAATAPIFVDFETRSSASLKTIGGRLYADHADTEIVCAVIRFPDGTSLVWAPGDPPPDALFDLLAKNVPVVAHNGDTFDRFVWKRLNWPEAGWVDTLPLARLAGLPGALDELGAALVGAGKDQDGKACTLRLSKPDRKTGKLPAITPETRARVAAYCAADVDLLARVWHAQLADLHGVERDVRRVDRVINDRGFAFDSTLAHAINACGKTASARAREGLPVSADVLASPAKLGAWLADVGVPVPNVQRATLKQLLREPTLPADARKVIGARLIGSGIAAPKLNAALRRCGSDGRLRDTLVYHAAHTGRWGGRGFQPQNLPRGDGVDLERAIPAVLNQDAAEIANIATASGITIADVLGALVRPCVRAPGGRVLGIMDYAQIEARALLWLADDEHGLAVFRRGDDPYRELAGALFGVAPELVSDDQRRLGKALVLGCGYGMGSVRFSEHAQKVGVDWTKTSVTPEKAVETWRDAHRRVAGWPVDQTEGGRVFRRGGFWRSLEKAARRAAVGARVEVGPTRWEKVGDDVACVLPSGRRLIYRKAAVEDVARRRGEEPRPTFTFEHRGERTSSHGCALAENVTQAVCRDILADALVRLERAGIAVVLHVHDEIVAELASEAELETMKQIMEAAPPWATGLPLAVEGFCSDRYRK